MENGYVGNQFDNYKGHERAEEFYKVDWVKDMADRIVSYLKEHPDDHIVPTTRSYKICVAGKRSRFTLRPLVMHAMGLEVSSTGYLRPSCGTAGCINPKCQVSAHQGGAGDKSLFVVVPAGTPASESKKLAKEATNSTQKVMSRGLFTAISPSTQEA